MVYSKTGEKTTRKKFQSFCIKKKKKKRLARNDARKPTNSTMLANLYKSGNEKKMRMNQVSNSRGSQILGTEQGIANLCGLGPVSFFGGGGAVS